MYFFFSVLGLCCCTGYSLVVASLPCSDIFAVIIVNMVVSVSLFAVASLIMEHSLQGSS